MDVIVTFTLAVILCVIPQKSVLCTELDSGMNLAECSFKLMDNQQCYNPLWCASLFFEPSRANQSKLHMKVDCLKYMLEDVLSKNLTLVNSQVEKMHSELDKLSKSFEEYEKQSSQLQEQKDELDSISRKFETIETTPEQINSKLDDFGKELSELRQSNTNIAKQIRTLVEDVKLTKDKSTEVVPQMETQNGNIEKANAKLESFENEFRKLQDTVATVNVELKKSDTIVVNLTNTIKNISVDLKTQEKAISNENAQRETLLSDLSNSWSKNISDSENKLHKFCTGQIQIQNNDLKSLAKELTNFGEKTNTSLTGLQNNLEEYRENTNNELKQTSMELTSGLKKTEDHIVAIEDKVKQVQDQMKGDIETKTKECFDKSSGKLEEKSKELNLEINLLSATMNKHRNEFKSEVETLSQTLTESENNLKDEIKTKTTQLDSDMKRTTATLESQLQEASSTTKLAITGTNNKVSEVESLIRDYKSDNEKQLSETKRLLEELVVEKVKELKSEFDESTKRVEENIKSLNTDIGEMIKDEVDKLSSQTEAVKEKVTQQKKIVDIIYPNTFNKEMLTIAILVLVVLMAINYVIVYVLVKRTSQSSDSTPNSALHTETREEPHSPVEVYNRLSFPKSLDLSEPLSSSVGVISFYEDSQKQHRRLMRVVAENIPEHRLPDVDLKYHVVRRHENIPGIPRAKLCIMFVEFTERHVIIEEPGLGLGDLKRKTAEHIRKIGACLVIVYTKDPGSRNLKTSELFNRSIHCVTSQPELVSLANNGRFLSVYDRLTDTQIERLVDIVTANLRQTGSGLHLRM